MANDTCVNCGKNKQSDASAFCTACFESMPAHLRGAAAMFEDMYAANPERPGAGPWIAQLQAHIGGDRCVVAQIDAMSVPSMTAWARPIIEQITTRYPDAQPSAHNAASPMFNQNEAVGHGKPFTLQCVQCDAGEGITSYEEAYGAGWRHVQFNDGSSWNFLGYCPDCLEDDDDDED